MRRPGQKFCEQGLKHHERSLYDYQYFYQSELKEYADLPTDDTSGQTRNPRSKSTTDDSFRLRIPDLNVYVNLFE